MNNFPDFRKGGVQVREYAGAEHTITYAGQCVVCGVRVYDGLNSSFLDHDNCALVASEYGKAGPDVPLCFNCSNDEPRYLRGMKVANRHWTEPLDLRLVPTDQGDMSDLYPTMDEVREILKGNG